MCSRPGTELVLSDEEASAMLCMGMTNDPT
jgi:hypothetical protein